MLKKITIGLVSVIALGVVIVGGINRTVAKTSDVYGSEAGTGKGRLSQSSHFDGSQSYSTAEDRGEINAGNGQGRQGGGRGQEDTVGAQLNLAAEQFTQLVSLEGKISNVDMSEEVLIETSDGQIILEGRALSFAVTQGFDAQAGDDVLLEGFFEDDEFEIVQITNQTNGLVTTLREPTGRPLWAGGGRTW